MTNNGRHVEVLRYGWRFTRDESENMTAVDFDDSSWQTVRVPHDWAIAGPFDRNNDIHVTRILEDGETTDREHTGRTGGLPHTGNGWYRLSFELPEEIATKRVRIEFDGVMSRSEVYCNGERVGGWPFGYSSFAFELTAFVKPGENTLAVTVNNIARSSRWYPGAGIFRHVRLVTLARVHVAHWGTYITTPAIDNTSATVKVRTEIACEATERVELETKIIDPDGEEVATVTDTRVLSADGIFEQDTVLPSPHLWSIDTPQLYTARSIVRIDREIVDCFDTTFGIRSLTFYAKTGFYLNGERTRLNGVCMHHDLGPLGSAVNRTAVKRQLEILKEMGCNSVRTSHNPPAPELLELSDEMGFLIIDEAFDEWSLPKCENGYHTLFEEWARKDMTALIRRDRNHPSVIMWSLGNEVPEQTNNEIGNKVCTFLHDIAHNLDPSRPTTAGFNDSEGAIENGLADTVDVAGWNYKPYWYARYHSEHPDMPMYGSETASTVSSRGEYYFPVDDEKGTRRDTLQVNSFDLTSPPWASCPDAEFRGVDENPCIMGEYVWTGFDYLGEPTPYGEEWPSRSSYFGIIDLCGIPKDRFYLYQSRWAKKETLHLLPHWTWPGREGECTPVHCYSSWDTVELFVNGVSQGIRRKHIKNLLSRYRLVWSGVTYVAGELKAVAYNKEGNTVKETVTNTAGAPAGIRLVSDRPSVAADGDDMAFVTVNVVDSDGTLVPYADNLVTFSINGPAEIAAVGNGNAATTEPFQAACRKAFNGTCMVYLRSAAGKHGTVTLKAESDGLTTADVEITAV